jgi:Uma2 family endonuclease
LIISPTGGGTGKRNIEISADFMFWNRQTKLGVCFDSSTCVKLPNGANRSPDVGWIKKERCTHIGRTGKFLTNCTRFCFRINVTQ